jgi:hypothetical protein
MKKLLLYFFISAFVFKMNAQVNLVPNPSFETYTGCPTGGSQINLATPWSGVTTNSTDYFNMCGTIGYNVPFCGASYQNAKTGGAFAGLWVINGYGSNYREYLQVKLDSTLKQDSCYLVNFYCNLDNTTNGINRIGAYLSSMAINTVGPGLVLSYIPQIVSSQFLTDTLNWMCVSGYYKASGGEQYITVGNFNTDIATDTLHNIDGTYNGSYYFIDDVTVKKIAGCDTTAGITEYSSYILFNLYPNPNNGTMTLEYSLSANEQGEFIIYDLTGKLITHYELDNVNNQLIISNKQLTNGIYFYHIKVNSKIVRNDKFIIIN